MQQPRTATPDPTPHPLPTSPLTTPEAIAQEIARQCAEPDRIHANLTQRRTQFTQLTQAETAPYQPPMPRSSAGSIDTIDAAKDPLGALIAASRLGPLPGCARLNDELGLQWQQLVGRPPKAGQSARMPAENGQPATTPARPSLQP